MSISRSLFCLVFGLGLMAPACKASEDAIAVPADLRVGPIDPLTVVSFNVYCPVCSLEQPWMERLPHFTRMLQYHQPDIVAAQELIIPLDAGHFLGALNGASGSGPVYAGKCRVNCDVTTYYRVDRLELLKEGSVWLSSWPYRFALWSIFRDKRNGNEFLFVNAHFDNDQPNQEKSARLLKAALQPWLDAALPVVVAGDFNSSPSGVSQVHDGHASSREGYRILDSYLANANELADRCTLYTNHGESESNRLALENLIDHIFVTEPPSPSSGSWRIQEWGIDYYWYGDPYSPRVFYPSDHWPVLTRLSYQTPRVGQQPLRACQPQLRRRS